MLAVVRILKAVLLFPPWKINTWPLSARTLPEVLPYLVSAYLVKKGTFLSMVCRWSLTFYSPCWVQDIYSTRKNGRRTRQVIQTITFIIIHCTHYQHSDWPRAPCLFWEFTWFCGQAWFKYNLLSNYVSRLYRAQCACVIHLWLKSSSIWMVSSDTSAWCICPVFLKAQIKSICISHDSFCIFPIKQCITKQ